jgi:hypothetical protein
LEAGEKVNSNRVCHSSLRQFQAVSTNRYGIGAGGTTGGGTTGAVGSISVRIGRVVGFSESLLTGVGGGNSCVRTAGNVVGFSESLLTGVGGGNSVRNGSMAGLSESLLTGEGGGNSVRIGSVIGLSKSLLKGT